MSLQLGELLESEGVADEAAWARVHERAKKQGQPEVAVLVDEEGMPEDALADMLARAVGTVVIDVARGTLDGEAITLVPEHVARRYFLVPVAADRANEAIRVAFANPLDDDAVQAVRESTGLVVQPLVATVTGVRAAIDREYRHRSTQVIRDVPVRRRPREDAPGEGGTVTHIIPPDGQTRSSTVPMRRLEQDATIEQRHEALLLALIENGLLTRADYVRALRRLLGSGHE